MRRLLLLALVITSPALAVSSAAEEFIAVSKQLEPVQCERRKLRREIALAARLEKRLAEREPPAALERSAGSRGNQPPAAR